MKRPDQIKTPGGNRASGEAAVQRRVNEADASAHVPTICLCRADRVCGWCFLQDRIAQAIHDSLRRQAQGELAGGAI